MSTVEDIFRIPDLRRKLIITLFLLGLCRLGVYVSVPGVDVPGLIATYEKAAQDSVAGRLLGLMDLFAGGAFGRCAVFGLGVMPYISASIIFQLLTSVVPALERLHREGEVGRKRIHQYTRMATVALCLVQGGITVAGLRSSESLRPFFFDAGMGFILMAAMLMTTGTMLLMWIGEQIDEFGIGNGISLIIMIGILDRLPVGIWRLASQATFSLNPEVGEVGPGKIVVLLAMFFGIVLGVVFITEGQRRIPFQQASHTRGRRVYVGQKHYLPLRVNQAGVIPIIFAQSLLMFPATIAHGVLSWYQASGATGALGYRFWLFVSEQLQGGTFMYIVFYMVLIFIFCFFWTAVQFNPQEMANNMKEHGTFILGIRPGRRTAEYLERLMTRITLPGAAFLAVIAILPMLLTRAMNVDWTITGFYGGTSLLIVVGVALDLVKKIESHLVMRHYDGFMRRSRGGGGHRRGGRSL
ncbi:MAG: preprotein translocase subunit SecY [Planctomycetota bacterium]